MKRGQVLVPPGLPGDDAPVAGEPGWFEDSWDDPRLLPKTHAERLPRNRRWLRWLLYLVVIALLGAILTGAAMGMWVARQVTPPGGAGDKVTFTVTETDTLESVIDRLKAQGIITNSRVFKAYIDRQGGLEVGPGYYEVRPRDTMGNIVKALRTPPAKVFTSVVFPEGFTLRQMSVRLADTIPRLQAAEFLGQVTEPGDLRSGIAGIPEGNASLEGLLFPAKYEVAGNESERSIIERMMKQMERVGRQEDIEAKSAALGMTPYQMLIIASIIEREAKNDEDRAKIARVILNRLFLGSALEVDATLYYGQDSETPFDVLRNTDTPYNTYMHPGLPPTPISNPGRASIRAALNPAPNPPSGDPICTALPSDDTPCIYLFYVLSDNDGHHAFAATYEQHLVNVEAARAAGLLG